MVLTIDSIRRVKTELGLSLILTIKAKRLSDSVWLRPEFLVNEKTGNFEIKPAENDQFGVMTSIVNLEILDSNPEKQNIRFVIQTGEKTPVWDYIVIQVIEFPWINLVWAGTIIMVIGFGISVFNRIQKQKQLSV